MLVLLCILALAGVLTTVATLAALHLVPTGLSPLRDPVSAYGISRHGALYRAQTLGTAVAAAALAVALPAAGITSSVPAVVALVVLALARGVISWVPMDAEGASRTSTGRRHDWLAYAAFAAASVGGFMVAIAFASTGVLDPAAAGASILGWVMTIAGAVTILASFVATLRPIFGLAERVIYLGMLTWLALTAITLVVR
jgi:hypothetical protein